MTKHTTADIPPQQQEQRKFSPRTAPLCLPLQLGLHQPTYSVIISRSLEWAGAIVRVRSGQSASAFTTCFPSAQCAKHVLVCSPNVPGVTTTTFLTSEILGCSTMERLMIEWAVMTLLSQGRAASSAVDVVQDPPGETHPFQVY